MILSVPLLRAVFQPDRDHIGGLVDRKASGDNRNSWKSVKTLVLQYDCGKQRQHSACRENRRPREMAYSDDKSRKRTERQQNQNRSHDSLIIPLSARIGIADDE